jgi:hypothetical protein
MIAIEYLPRGRFVEAKNSAAQCRLPATGFTNQAKRLTRVDIDRDTINGLNYMTASSRKIEINFEIAYSKQRLTSSAGHGLWDLWKPGYVCFLSAHILFVRAFPDGPYC